MEPSTPASVAPHPVRPRAPEAAPPALSARETWRILYGHVRPHRVTLLGGGLLGLLGGAAGLAQPLAAKELVDALAADEPVAAGLWLLTALVLLGAVSRALGQYLLARTAESVVLSARRKLAAKVLSLWVREMDRTKPGDVMSRLTTDTTLLREAASQSLVSAVIGSLTLMATVVLMGLLDPVLLIATLAVSALIGGGVGLVMPRIARATHRAQESVGALAAAMERVLGAFRTVKAAGAEARERAVFDAAAHDAWRHGLRSAKWQSVAATAAGLAVQASFLTVLGIGGVRVGTGAVPVSTLIAFLLLLFYLTDPISRLLQAVSQFQAGRAAVARTSQIHRLSSEPAPGDTAVGRGTTNGGTDSTDGTGAARGPNGPNGPDGPDGPDGPASVELRQVFFRYGEDLPHIHRGVSFHAPGPGVTALVGSSGAGKTTVFGLIERFHDATEGQVLVDGRDVTDWPLDRLRAAIGYVEQDAPVLAGTLRDNLLYAAPAATEDDLRDVLLRTRLDGLVARLPRGLETPVGHRGSTLSGGERQRVAIARALLRRPRVLLLDEATSQLDAVNELALRQVMADVSRDTTVLVIAHRLSTVTTADRIVVLDGGLVRATGTHDQLLTSDTLYRDLAATQFLTPA